MLRNVPAMSAAQRRYIGQHGTFTGRDGRAATSGLNLHRSSKTSSPCAVSQPEAWPHVHDVAAHSLTRPDPQTRSAVDIAARAGEHDDPAVWSAGSTTLPRRIRFWSVHIAERSEVTNVDRFAHGSERGFGRGQCILWSRSRNDSMQRCQSKERKSPIGAGSAPVVAKASSIPDIVFGWELWSHTARRQ